FLPKISEAMDGRREAHMDVLVAVFGRKLPPPLTTKASRLGQEQAGNRQSQQESTKAKNEKTR
ncbi:hypothetical protein ACQUWM_05310, partial [Marinobacter sp. DUT-3]|uniref:hypothetical protein n=1 Tax=Marinobacter sp. DUT-3 TaxID=3412036 RepID=UPI003D169B6F